MNLSLNTFFKENPYENIPAEILNPINNIDKNVSAREGELGYLIDHLLKIIKPELIIEVGSYLGASAITFGKHLKDNNLDTKILCIDTFIGASNHWEQDEWRGDLNIQHGVPHMFNDFCANVVRYDMQDRIIPMVCTSLDAGAWLLKKGVKADFIYIDSSHDEMTTYAECHTYWALLKEGGILFGDDYSPGWGVIPAVNRFANDIKKKVVTPNCKWAIQKV
jgi:predicted O-methyltransferase YrrM